MAKKTTKTIKSSKKTKNPEIIVNTLGLTNEEDTRLAIINAKIAAAKENVTLTIDELQIMCDAIADTIKNACVAQALKNIFSDNDKYFVDRVGDNLNVAKVIDSVIDDKYRNVVIEDKHQNIFKRAYNWIKSKFDK